MRYDRNRSRTWAGDTATVWDGDSDDSDTESKSVCGRLCLVSVFFGETVGAFSANNSDRASRVAYAAKKAPLDGPRYFVSPVAFKAKILISGASLTSLPISATCGDVLIAEASPGVLAGLPDTGAPFNPVRMAAVARVGDCEHVARTSSGVPVATPWQSIWNRCCSSSSSHWMRCRAWRSPSIVSVFRGRVWRSQGAPLFVQLRQSGKPEH